jgi:hypothetical protein
LSTESEIAVIVLTLPTADNLGAVAIGSDRATDANPAIEAAPLAFNWTGSGEVAAG